jgi:hypothetical protein
MNNRATNSLTKISTLFDSINKKKFYAILFTALYLFVFVRIGNEYSIYQKVFLSGFYAMLLPIVLFLLLWPLAFCVLIVWMFISDFYKWIKVWIKT